MFSPPVNDSIYVIPIEAVESSSTSTAGPSGETLDKLGAALGAAVPLQATSSLCEHRASLRNNAGRDKFRMNAAVNVMFMLCGILLPHCFCHYANVCLLGHFVVLVVIQKLSDERTFLKFRSLVCPLRDVEQV